MIDQETLPVSDDAQNQGPSEQELLDAVMQNSPIMEELDVPLPEEEEIAEDPEESEVEDPEESEEAVSEEEEEVEESEGEDTRMRMPPRPLPKKLMSLLLTISTWMPKSLSRLTERKWRYPLET